MVSFFFRFSYQHHWNWGIWETCTLQEVLRAVHSHGDLAGGVTCVLAACAVVPPPWGTLGPRSQEPLVVLVAVPSGCYCPLLVPMNFTPLKPFGTSDSTLNIIKHKVWKKIKHDPPEWQSEVSGSFETPPFGIPSYSRVEVVCLSNLDTWICWHLKQTLYLKHQTKHPYIIIQLYPCIWLIVIISDGFSKHVRFQTWQ